MRSGVGVAALVVALLVLGASRADAAISVTIGSPPAVLIAQSSPLRIGVTVTSTFDVASVEAHVGALTTTLAPATLPSWAGELVVTSLPYGNHVLVVTATDVLGATATASVTFLHDEPPVITVQSPVANTVARPSIHVVATCTDDNPGGICVNFGASIPGGNALGGGGTNMIDGTIDLTAVDGAATELRVRANGPFGTIPGVRLPVFVENSPDLVEVASLGTRMLDVDGTRLLYVDGAGMVRVRRRSDGAETPLGPIADLGASPPFGRLTSTGAVYVAKLAPGCMNPEEAFEWRGAGAPVSLGVRCRASGFEEAWPIAGDWGWWPAPGGGGGVIRHDYATGVSTTVTFPPDVGGAFLTGNRYSIVANGDLLAIIGDGDAVRFVRDRGGVQTELGRGSKGSQNNPVFDGIAIAYLHPGSPNDRAALIRDGLAPLVLGDPLIPQYPFQSYAVGGGWVAFTRVSATSGARQVWRRSPAGDLANVAPFAADSVVDVVAPDGQLTVVTDGATRYLATDAPGPPLHVGSELGRARFLGDGLYVLVGRTLLRHGSGAVAIDAGVPDAAPATDASVDAATGAIDAGVTDASDTDAGAAKPGGGGCAVGRRDGGGGLGAAVALALALAGRWRRRRRRRCSHRR